ncbi:MAG TPA: hypothetical protein VIC04_02365 [Terriglobia bacterium]|jgi:hypothetical protein
MVGASKLLHASLSACGGRSKGGTDVPQSKGAEWRWAGLAFFLLLIVAWPASAADSATITYRKIFKGSSPEFVEVKISESGACSYDLRLLSEEPDPQPFEVGPALRAKIFELAGQANNFKDVELDVKRRIANLGEKTFRYERGNEANEAAFNYTTHPAAAQLQMIFEGLSRQQEHLRTILHRMRYDRLGVNSALLNFETDLDRKILPEPERLIPALEQLAGDSRFVEIARQRARALITRIKNKS